MSEIEAIEKQSVHIGLISNGLLLGLYMKANQSYAFNHALLISNNSILSLVQSRCTLCSQSLIVSDIHQKK